MLSWEDDRMYNWQDVMKTVANAAGQVNDAAKAIKKSLKKQQKAEESTSVVSVSDNKKKAIGVLTAVGAVTVAVGVGYALYRWFAPNYLHGFSEDDYKDDFDDYFEDEDEASSDDEESRDSSAAEDNADAAEASENDAESADTAESDFNEVKTAEEPAEEKKETEPAADEDKTGTETESEKA